MSDKVVGGRTKSGHDTFIDCRCGDDTFVDCGAGHDLFMDCRAGHEMGAGPGPDYLVQGVVGRIGVGSLRAAR